MYECEIGQGLLGNSVARAMGGAVQDATLPNEWMSFENSAGTCSRSEFWSLSLVSCSRKLTFCDPPQTDPREGGQTYMRGYYPTYHPRPVETPDPGTFGGLD